MVLNVPHFYGMFKVLQLTESLTNIQLVIMRVKLLLLVQKMPIVGVVRHLVVTNISAIWIWKIDIFS